MDTPVARDDSATLVDATPVDATLVDDLERQLAQARERLERVRQARSRAAAQAAPGTAAGATAPGAAPGATVGIPRRGGDRSRAPLSFAQDQLWFLDRLAPGRATYNIPVPLRLRGALDATALAGALTDVVRRHEPLRTTFHADERGVAYTSILPPVELALPVLDLSGVDPAGRESADTESALAAALAEDAQTPFDLSADLKVRARLIRLGPDEHVLSLVVHHISTDGWSAGLLVTELGRCYRARRDHEPADLATLAIDYGDYAAWQRERVGELDRHLDYWATQLAGAPVLEFPTDRPRPATPSYRGAKATYRMPADVLAGLRALSRDSGASLFAVLYAGLNAVLSRYTGSEDIVAGTTSLGRTRPELESMVGFFVNVLVVRTDLSGDPTFREIVERTMRTLLDGWDHREAPFDKVVERSGARRDPSRNPLFQIGMDLQSATLLDFEIPGLAVEYLDVDIAAARFDIAVNGFEESDGIEFQIEYATDLFDASTIQRIFTHIERVLRAGTADPSLRLSRLPLLTDAERELIVTTWQGPAREFSTEPVHVQIARMAATQPEHPAAELDGVTLSFGELDRRADNLAHRLRARGVGRDDIVGLFLERGFDALVGMLGILKAGGAFAVMDPEHPPRRLAYLLADTATRTVVTRRDLVDRLGDSTGWAAVFVDEEQPGLPAGPPPEVADESSLVYVLYTSGSTGRPKGVVINHRALSNQLLFMGDVFDLGPADRTLQHMALIFDFGIGEIFAALVRGATLVFAPEAGRTDPGVLGHLLATRHVTHVNGPPAIIGRIEGEFPDLKYMIMGGEHVPAELINRWNVAGRLVVHGYGPTEATVGCTYYECERGVAWATTPPIGRAMPNRTAYILDRYGNLAPVGVAGEIVTGGEGLAIGYLNHPELTAEKFVDDPVRPGGRIYRTGDLGVWTPDGQIRILGRIDTQVKLNGLRVELEEIEAVLASHPAIAQATVALRADEGGQRLVGYLVPVAGASAPDEDDIRAHLIGELPPYLVPQHYVVLDALPLTRAGKIDRAALPAPDVAPREVDFLAPRTAAETTVADAFAAVLGRAGIGATDNFFELGGNSLQALQVISRLGGGVSIRDLYASPSVAMLAALLPHTGTGAADAPVDDWELLAQVEGLSDEEAARLLGEGI
jgi:amino acid adenylation domain-containing protein